MNLISDIEDMKDEMTDWRRQIHACPELAYNEHKTSEFIAEKLVSWGIKTNRHIGKTGVVGTIEGKSVGNVSLGLRADMDALPMAEETGLPYASKSPGVMHACGHDGHSAILLGAAQYLSKTRNFTGTVHVIFQPAEEGGAGAKAMIDDALFQKFPCDKVFALHNWPGEPVGKIGVRSGPMLAAADMLEIEVIGKGGHAAMPQHVVDPTPISAQIILALQTLVSRRTDPLDSAVISITQVEAGTTFNIIPEKAGLKGTVRSLQPETRNRIEKEISALVSGICHANGASGKVNYIRCYPPVVNHEAETQIAALVAESVVGKENVIHNYPPTMGGEDFAFMLEKIPGSFVVLGQAAGPDAPMLHHPKYDFNDAVLPIGASFFASLVENILN